VILALVVTLAIALTVPGFIFAVRALPWVDRQVKAAIKPWVCDICMSFWGTVIFTLLAVHLAHNLWLLLCAGPAYTLAMIILSFMERPTSMPAIPAPPPPPAEGGIAEILEP
jgi:hypothetical protein